MTKSGPTDAPCLAFIARLLKLVTGLFSLLLLGATASAETSRVRIAVGEWPPYFSEEAEGYGTYAQVVTHAFELAGIDVEYGFFPWKRAFLETQEGRWPVSAGWGKTPAREPYFHFCDPVLVQREQFFFSTDKPVAAEDWQDLAGLSLGVIEGAALGEDLDRLVADGRLTVFHQSTLEDLFEMLSVGHVDLVMGNENAALEAISAAVPEGETARFRALKSLDVEWDYRVIVSKMLEDGARLCERFNKGLSALRESGDYERLLWPERPEDATGNSPS